jgi:predicted RNA-binding Zn-ribbon protein involved in translation (DUF1610 family)
MQPETANTPEVTIEYDKLGFVKGYGCPQCGSKVKFSHKDDAGTKFYKCEKCGETSAKLKVAEKLKPKKQSKPVSQTEDSIKNCECCKSYLT